MATSSWGAAWGLAFGAAWGALAVTPQPLTQADIDAIVAACWAHPQGQAYLAKIYQIEALSIACGNPCCHGAYLPPAGHAKRAKHNPNWPYAKQSIQFDIDADDREIVEILTIMSTLL